MTAYGESADVPGIEAIKQGMRASWMAGDFGVVAKTNAGAAEAFVGRLGVQPGERVLDVACGTGNLAIPIARLGAATTGLDLAPNLLVQARERAAAEGLSIGFDEGDAEQLPYADGSFDRVVTMFGAMFAPRPERVAAELARVLRPGGRLDMANWTPGSFTAGMFRVGARFAPPAAGVPPAILWGDDAMARQRLEKDFTEIQTEVIAMDFDLPTTPAGAVGFFRKYFGPTHMTFNRLDAGGQAAFAAELKALWADANVSTHPEDQTLIRNHYLQVTAVRR